MPQLNEEHIGVLRDLAEGRIEPRDWLAWWNANAAALEPALSRGAFLALKPRRMDSSGANVAALGSQSGACKVLDQLKISYERSGAYQLGWRADFQVFSRAKNAEEVARKAEFEPRIATLQACFPRLAKFPCANPARIREIGEPASDDELTKIATDLGTPLPVSYAKLLRCARTLIVDDVLQMTSMHPFVHRSTRSELPTDGMLCIADFWLEADGDQAMIDIRAEISADPPVLYYSHEAQGPKLRTFADRFTEWVEGLPRVLAE